MNVDDRVVSDDEAALILWLLLRKRSKAEALAAADRHAKRILIVEGLAVAGLEAKVERVIRGELEDYAHGADVSRRKRMAAIAARIAPRLAEDITPLVLQDRADALPRNRPWVTGDSVSSAVGAMHVSLARALGLAVRWVTERDERVCKICRPLDGMVFATNDVPTYPAHPRCRCHLIPVLGP